MSRTASADKSVGVVNNRPCTALASRTVIAASFEFTISLIVRNVTTAQCAGKSKPVSASAAR
jgi:hypothetical protein